MLRPRTLPVRCSATMQARDVFRKLPAAVGLDDYGAATRVRITNPGIREQCLDATLSLPKKVRICCQSA